MASSASAAAWFFAHESIARHENYQSNAYDLGFFDQIIWNTAHGRPFETSFVRYNFLGQHFDPVLLALAGIYRLGGGIETLLQAQAVVAALAAVPLYLAAERLCLSKPAAALLSLGFLLSPTLHEALNFDFHPELGALFFVFLGAYFLAAERPATAVALLLPLLALKEDLALVLLAFAAVIALRGYRRQAKLLGAVAVVWIVAIVLVAMPLIRGGGSDLSRRYAYLVDDSTAVTLVPDLAGRAVSHLAELTSPSLAGEIALTGGLALLSPLILVIAAPVVLVNGLADHPEQAGLHLHYAVPTLSLLWLAALLGLERLAAWARTTPRLRSTLPVVAGGLVLAASAVGFLTSSPFAPGVERHEPSAGDRRAIEAALRLIPSDASVNAQSALLPHLSQRRDVFEFPDKRRSDYVIVASGLPMTQQSLDRGYQDKLAHLPEAGYERIFDDHGVEVWRARP